MTTHALGDEVAEALVALAKIMADAEHPWWLIGSVAVALHGGDPGGIADIDVLLDPRDASGMIERTGAVVRDKDESPLFRSETFTTWNALSIPVEFMAGFHLFADGAWQPVCPATRIKVVIGGGVVFVPDRAELIAMLDAFGRRKDLRRAATLARLAT